MRNDCTASEIAEIQMRVDHHMRTTYGVSLFDMRITDTPGYWEDILPKMHHGHPLNNCLGCGGPFRATYTYFDSLWLFGRFSSSTRSWNILKTGRIGGHDAS